MSMMLFVSFKTYYLQISIIDMREYYYMYLETIK